MGRPPVYLVWVLPSAMLRTAACRSGSITGDASFARPPVPRAHVGQNLTVTVVSSRGVRCGLVPEGTGHQAGAHR